MSLPLGILVGEQADRVVNRYSFPGKAGVETLDDLAFNTKRTDSVLRVQPDPEVNALLVIVKNVSPDQPSIPSGVITLYQPSV